MGAVIQTGQALRSIVTRRSMLPPPATRDDPKWEESWDYLFQLYTPAMERYVRSILARALGNAQAEAEAGDVVQEYLAQALDKGWLSGDADLRCFRAYLQSQLRRYVYKYLDHKFAKKRHVAGTTSDDALVGVGDSELDPANAELDEGWVEVSVQAALRQLQQGNQDYYEVIADLLRTQGEGSEDLGARMNRSEQQLVHLRHRARKRFAVLFHEHLRESVRDDEAFDELCDRLESYLP